MMDRSTVHLVNQMFVVSGVMSALLSCGLGLGYLAAFMDYQTTSDSNGIDANSLRLIDVCGEISFVPAIIVIPYAMQKKGRRIASLITIVPLLLSWLISFTVTNKIELMVVNILYHVALGGTVAISSVIVSEFTSPRYRGAILMLETAMISLGILLSHLFGIYSSWKFISLLGVMSSLTSLAVTYFSPESPYWLISQGHILEGTDVFYWIRGYKDETVKELDALLMSYKMKFQLEALGPIMKKSLKESVVDYAKSLLNADFLKPLSIMILLFTFVGFGGENSSFGYSFRDLFKLTKGKYIGTIILDVITLVCSLTACVLIQIVKRKTLFLFTGSFSMLFLALTSLVVFLQSVEMFSTEYLWLLLTCATGFAMFMSLGTTALPFSFLGEIFPMSYRGVGSSLTCAYLWALSNSIVKSLPQLNEVLGLHGLLLTAFILMLVVMVVLWIFLPETDFKTLMEIEQLMKTKNGVDEERHGYEVVNVTDYNEEYYDWLNILIY